MVDNRIPSSSQDLIEENIEKLKGLFPEVVTEGKIDLDMLKTVLGEAVDDRQERYRFEWHGKRESLLGAQQPSKGTLRPDVEASKNFDTTKNLYIEGDNLEVLKLLQKSYNGKVKVIYIDPPYNTGNDFVYKDDFKKGVDNYLEQTGQIDAEGNKLDTKTESTGRYHTDWLNMMYPRLKLARNLLKDDGVIFISIDDNELDNLKKITDEIFGPTNFLGRIMPVVNPGGRDYKQIALTHEYLLVYGKSEKTTLSEIKKDVQFKFTDEDGGFELRDLRNRNPKFHSGNRPNLFYPFYVNPAIKDEYGNCAVSLEQHDGYSVEIKPYNSVGRESVWRWGKERSSKNIMLDNPDSSEIVARPKRDGSYTISEKNRRSTTKVKSIWDETEMRTENGTRLIRELFGYTSFDHPKPVPLLERILEMSHPSDIILDFFSGSATTAHAALKLNAEDGGNRKFIMIQLPEALEEDSEAYQAGYRNICEIGQDRIRKAGERVLDEYPQAKDSLDVGFKVLKLDKSNIREWNVDFDTLEEQITSYDNMFVPSRSELDVVYEIMLKYGLELTHPIKTFQVDGKNIYDIAAGNLFICLDDDINIAIAQAIIDKRNDYGIDTSSVVFADHGFAGNDSEKLNCFKLLQDAGYQDEQLLTI